MFTLSRTIGSRKATQLARASPNSDTFRYIDRVHTCDARVGPLSAGRGGLACGRTVRVGLVRKYFLSTLRSEMIENEHADCRREIVTISIAGDRCYQRRSRQIFVTRNLTQSIPKLILKRHTCLMPVDINRPFDCVYSRWMFLSCSRQRRHCAPHQKKTCSSPRKVKPKIVATH